MTQFAKHKSAPIDASNPWSDDVLNRRGLAEQLTAALSTVTQPFVLGLHGEFGNGKTFFIKRWQHELHNLGDVAVYFNAWETDYAAEPLIAFTAAIKRQLQEHELVGGREAAKALATSAGRIILKSVLPRAISLATGGLLQATDVSSLTAIGDDIAGAASDIAEHAVEEAVKHHEQARHEVERFRSILRDCARAIGERETGRVRRLIVFVDELDRCRPDYAIHVLECRKHFFSVDHVIFVVAVDRGALDASVSAVYGNKIDVDGYARKFFDYHIEISQPDHGAFALLLGQSFRLKEAIPSRYDIWIELLSYWSRILNLPLRVQEQVVSQANFILRSYEREQIWIICDLILLLLLVRARHTELFDAVVHDQIRSQILLARIEKLVGPHGKDANFDQYLHNGVAILVAGFVPPDAVKAEHALLTERLSNKPSDHISAAERQSMEQQINTLTQAIEITEQLRYGRPLGPAVVRRIRFLTE